MPSTKKLLQAAAGSSVGGTEGYVEDVFSTYLYVTAGGTNAITNGIDFSGEGGMVWTKSRKNTNSFYLGDTTRGGTSLSTNTTAAKTGWDAFSYQSTGFTDIAGFAANIPTTSWSFRKAKKFFDVVTYTGNGTAGRTVSHSLGSTPGMVIVKKTSATGLWATLHKDANLMYLERTNGQYSASSTGAMFGDGTNVVRPTASVFTVGAGDNVNTSGQTYVAYLFASDAGGFGEDGDESIIKCGIYNGDDSAKQTINLGWEAQWVLIKKITSASSWVLVDVMRGMVIPDGSNNDPSLFPNEAVAEVLYNVASPSAVGFNLDSGGAWWNSSSESYIYMAIRRGPMKIPDDATKVFQALTYSGNDTFNSGIDPVVGVQTRTISSSLGFDVDMSLTKWLSGTSASTSSSLMDRLRGVYYELFTYSSATENQNSNTGPRFSTRGSRQFDLHNYGVYHLNKNGQSLLSYVFSRAPGFMDVVCYTGDGASARAVPHGLTVAPEFYVVKSTDNAYDWQTYSATMGNNYSLRFNQANGIDVLGTWPYWANTSPTATAFSVGDSGSPGVVNGNNALYVCYLFATLAGVSKVGGYTGTGNNLNVDCGFSAGARFILIKRTDTTGDWYFWDSVRGITAGNDPYSVLNTTAAQVTNTDYIDPLSSGFIVTSSAPAGLNANSGNYIFLAIA